MPINSERMKLYPGGSIRSPEWLAIRARLSERAGGCCEKCRVRNHAVGYRRKDTGEFIEVKVDRAALGFRIGYTIERRGAPVAVYSKLMRIVCTVAHLDGLLVDHTDENLRFWCQRCHLAHDAAQHAESARLTRESANV